MKTITHLWIVEVQEKDKWYPYSMGPDEKIQRIFLNEYTKRHGLERVRFKHRVSTVEITEKIEQ